MGLRGGRGKLAVKEEKDQGNVIVKRKGSLMSLIFVGWLYFLSVALAVPALPRLVNNIMGGKDTVSPQSQMALASIMVGHLPKHYLVIAHANK